MRALSLRSAPASGALPGGDKNRVLVQQRPHSSAHRRSVAGAVGFGEAVEVFVEDGDVDLPSGAQPDVGDGVVEQGLAQRGPGHAHVLGGLLARQPDGGRRSVQAALQGSPGAGAPIAVVARTNRRLWRAITA